MLRTQSGRLDSNQRSPAPKAGAVGHAGLRPVGAFTFVSAHVFKSLTFSTLPPPIFDENRIPFIVRVTFSAFGFLAIVPRYVQTSSFTTIQHVVTLCSSLQVSRIDTRWVVTSMANLCALRVRGFVDPLHDEPVRENKFAVHFESPVALFTFRCGPLDTTRFPLFSFGPKAFNHTIIHAHHAGFEPATSPVTGERATAALMVLSSP